LHRVIRLPVYSPLFPYTTLFRSVGVGWGAFASRRPGYMHQQWAELEPHLRSGALNPLISTTLPLERAAKALAIIDERRVTGKVRSEEHTSELQSREKLVCRLLLE